MDKNDRHRIIKEIVAARPIAKQEDLVKALNDRGLTISQATVSRDITEIPLQKVRTPAGFVYHWQGPVGDPNGTLARIMRESVFSVERSENLVLLKTAPGLAAPVAIGIDRAQLDLALGTVAGDDTVLVVAKDREAGGPLHEMLKRMIGSKNV